MGDLTPEQRTEFSEIFKLLDKDEKKELNADGIMKACRTQFGMNPNPKELDEMIKEMKSYGGGRADLAAFIAMFGDKLKSGDSDVEVRMAFKQFDPQDTGFISVDDYYEALTQMGDVKGRLKKAEADTILTQVKVVDGKVQISSLMHVILSR